MSDTKGLLRRSVLEQRRLLGDEARRAKSELIGRRIIELLKHRDNLLTEEQILFSYMPFGDEADVLPVVEWCWSQGIRTAVPLTLRNPNRMKLYLIDDLNQLKPGVWGIREPDGTTQEVDPIQVGAVLVPGVAFDRTGGRLGYGGGYYDRFFEELKQQGRGPLKLAPAFDIQLVDEVPMEQHDERMDLLVTETVVYKF